MRKIKLFSAVFLTVLLMTSCGKAVSVRDGECGITVTSKGKSIALSETAAEELTLLTEKILSDGQTGITKMNLIISENEVKRFGREGLSIAVEYRNARELPISAVDYSADNGKAEIVTNMYSVDKIWILADGEKRYITSNGGTFCLSREYYGEIMEYIE